MEMKRNYDLIRELSGGMELSTDEESFEIRCDLSPDGSGRGFVAFTDAEGEKYYIKFFREDASQNAERFYWACFSVGRSWQVPRFVHAGWYGKRFFIVEKALDGRTLREKLSGPVGMFEFVQLMKKTVVQLWNLHRVGIVHADVSPDNIVVSGDRIFLIDFDTVYFTDSEKEAVGLMTPGYSEALSENGRKSAASDIYSVGRILRKYLEKREGTALSEKALKDAAAACLKTDPEERPDDRAILSLLTEAQTVFLLEKAAASLKIGNVRSFTYETNGGSEIGDAKVKMQIPEQEQVLFLLKGENHRKIAFTKTGIYLAHTSVGKKLEHTVREEPSFISFDRVLCLTEEDIPEKEDGKHALVLTRDAGNRIRMERINCQKFPKSVLHDLVNDVVVARENLFSVEARDRYYRRQCEKARDQLGKDSGKRETERQWKMIEFLALEAGGQCDRILLEIYPRMAAYYGNSQNDGEKKRYEEKLKKLQELLRENS